jgi:hypothetical protein
MTRRSDSLHPNSKPSSVIRGGLVLQWLLNLRPDRCCRLVTTKLAWATGLMLVRVKAKLP